MRQKKLKPYDSTLVTLSISCSKELELDLAEALLDQVSKFQHPGPFNALLASCDKMVSSSIKLWITNVIVCFLLALLKFSLVEIQALSFSKLSVFIKVFAGGYC